MTHAFPQAQAALIFAQTPDLDFDSLLDGLNETLAAQGYDVMTPNRMSSPQFALMANDLMHASVAIHTTPLGRHGLGRALTAPATRTRKTEFGEILDHSPVHLILTVGEGSTPLSIDAPKPIILPARLAVLQMLIRLVHQQSPCMAAHLCAADVFCRPADIESWKMPLSPALLIHPEPTGPMTGPEGEAGTGLIAHQSHHLLGRTLVFEGIPAKVPLEMMMTLADTVIRQHLKGALPLAHGDRIKDAIGMSLYIRHASDAYGELLVLSFWPSAPTTGQIATINTFPPHRGYGAVGVDASPKPEVSDEWFVPGTEPGRITADKPSGGFPTWIVLVAIGVFLWIGLPMLNIPQMAIQAAFSNDRNSLATKP